MDVFETTLSLLDWRRRVSALYAEIRATTDSEKAWRHWRDARAALFTTHSQTPLDTAGEPPRYHAYDPALRFTIALAPAKGAPRRSLPIGADGEVALAPFARTVGLAGPLGKELTLYWMELYGGGVFLPFLDATSGAETYGGGRYLLDTIKGADLGSTPDGRLILDFNFAYNPSCAYSPRWTCPLASADNRVSATVRAGEVTPRFDVRPANVYPLDREHRLAAPVSEPGSARRRHS